MRNLMNELNEKYLVNGENNKYATLYENEDDVIEIFGDVESFIGILDINPQRKLSAETINYPVIAFDTSGSVGGELFEANQVDEVLEVASYYFNKQ